MRSDEVGSCADQAQKNNSGTCEQSDAPFNHVSKGLPFESYRVMLLRLLKAYMETGAVMPHAERLLL